tara:strand:- start:18 stop:386 length:369 start_codon:yes stop_codon:yes gene_type:complete
MGIIITIFLVFFLSATIGIPLFIIVKERVKKKKQFEELPDDDEEIPDEIFEEQVGTHSIFLSAHEQDAYKSLSFKQKKALKHKQIAMVNKGELIVVDHPNGGKGLITRLEAIKTGLINPKTK